MSTLIGTYKTFLSWKAQIPDAISKPSFSFSPFNSLLYFVKDIEHIRVYLPTKWNNRQFYKTCNLRVKLREITKSKTYCLTNRTPCFSTNWLMAQKRQIIWNCIHFLLGSTHLVSSSQCGVVNTSYNFDMNKLKSYRVPNKILNFAQLNQY